MKQVLKPAARFMELGIIIPGAQSLTTQKSLIKRPNLLLSKLLINLQFCENVLPAKK
jgi:hypothetical protein